MPRYEALQKPVGQGRGKPNQFPFRPEPVRPSFFDGLGFDFNFPGPVQSMERFLRILDYYLNKTIYDMSFQICKFQCNDAQFLKYRPSVIAACAIILAINIYERDLEKYQNKNFFQNSKTNAEGLM